MKLTEQQAFVLVDVLRHVIDQFATGTYAGVNFGYTEKSLRGLYEEIMYQQSDVLVDLQKEEEK